MLKQISHVLALGISIAFAATASNGYAQSYPTRNITLVVGFTAGGAGDVVARRLGEKLSKKLGTNIIVQNTPGANGVIAAQAVANADPDGYTLLLANDSLMTVEPQLSDGSHWNPLEYLDPIVEIARGPLFIVANKTFQANTIPELVEYAKASGQTISFGTSGPSSPHRLAGEILQKLGGSEMTHIPSKGTSAAMTDLAGGQITLAIAGMASITPLADAGKVKLLAAMSKSRSSLMPDLPTVSETYSGFDFNIYFAILTPKNTPADVVEKLNETINQTLDDPETVKAFQAMGFEPAGGSASDLQKVVQDDYAKFSAVLSELGMKAK